MNDNGNGSSTLEDESSRNHLSDEELSAYLDQSLSSRERTSASAHIASCSRCSEELHRLGATSLLLRSLPEPRPARSFQLPVDFARSRWQRIGLALTPAIPALRVA